MRLVYKVIFFPSLTMHFFFHIFFFILVEKKIKNKNSLRGGWKDMIGCEVFNCRILGYLK